MVCRRIISKFYKRIGLAVGTNFSEIVIINEGSLASGEVGQAAVGRGGEQMA
jgi:hypothetical protein